MRLTLVWKPPLSPGPELLRLLGDSSLSRLRLLELLHWLRLTDSWPGLPSR